MELPLIPFYFMSTSTYVEVRAIDLKKNNKIFIHLYPEMKSQRWSHREWIYININNIYQENESWNTLDYELSLNILWYLLLLVHWRLFEILYLKENCLNYVYPIFLNLNRIKTIKSRYPLSKWDKWRSVFEIITHIGACTNSSIMGWQN